VGGDGARPRLRSVAAGAAVLERGSSATSRSPAGAAPNFLVAALADETPLAKVQIIKGWVDAAGGLREQVYDVAGSPGGTVDPATCRWSTYMCNSLGPAERTQLGCDNLPQTIQERAWTSPIWY
jgi:hypothetical protein